MITETVLIELVPRSANEINSQFYSKPTILNSTFNKLTQSKDRIVSYIRFGRYQEPAACVPLEIFTFFSEMINGVLFSLIGCYIYDNLSTKNKIEYRIFKRPSNKTRGDSLDEAEHKLSKLKKEFERDYYMNDFPQELLIAKENIQNIEKLIIRLKEDDPKLQQAANEAIDLLKKSNKKD